jgi:hypothetical protein
MSTVSSKKESVMKRYEVTTLNVPIGVTPKAFPLINDYVSASEAKGKLLACWYSDIGALNQVMVIRGFENDADLAVERERVLVGGNPFGIGEFLTAMSIDSYAPFPFLPPIQPGQAGPFYEVRVYGIKPSGLAPTIEAWRNAVPPRTELSPLTIAMYALDGTTPRFMNIWPYKSLDERQKIRAAAVESGVWPPKGGPQHLTTLQSTFFLPADFSPLR